MLFKKLVPTTIHHLIHFFLCFSLKRETTDHALALLSKLPSDAQSRIFWSYQL